ncbi:MAG: TonB family protein [Flavobacteriaceae bacterium]
MNLTNQHKALLITFCLSGTVLLSLFAFHIKKHSLIAAESYYELESEKELTEEEKKYLEALEKLNNTKAETNQAFNKTNNPKHFAQAYKPITPAKDYVPQKSSEQEGFADNTNPSGEIPDKDFTLKKDDLSAFSKVNDLLKQQQTQSVNTKSTMYYSLVGRTHLYMPTPIYLCENGGKIVVNITVNANGKVTDAYINTSSTSDNECLKERALEYAKEAVFNADTSKKEQLGSITFNFVGKN